MFNIIDKKRLNEKFKRTIKYWRVRYQQTSARDRLNLSLFAFLMIAYTWWMFMVL